ncbi:hypothetical protein SOCEGT47_043130 [Sorangium cellulosum]|uniref:DUF4139 domain-containing protein n=1 Tax=Sorangium cellulosum TaxID=56 RepID=A0A4P2Q4D3_SORCE|nr:DUF4139 domain-containing protein [Sorangium cellulosum]AUX23783.1 hypothetical protein SOCEGT47_043130 [Sorangium cellulosum]
MKHGLWTTATLAAALGLSRSEPETDAVETDALSLRRVVLSTGGVGYFEYEARVRGDAELPLVVRLDQVDDVLKSIVAYDDRGTVGSITLPGREPLRDLFRELPFDEGALESEAALLNALRGAEVRASGPRGAVVGRIVAVTPVQAALPGGGSENRHRLALMSDGALKQVVLEELAGVELVEERLRQQVGAALVGLARQRERGRRELVVHARGEGERVVRVAYVAEAPLWKTSYRLTIADDPGARTGALSGWAVVENQSGADWKDVDFTLVSGDPVTFRQALYELYYVDRPEVPVDLAARVLPRLDEGAAALTARAARLARYRASAAREAGTAGPPAPAGPAGAPAREEAATQVTFHFPAPVTIPSGQTALLPIVEREIPVERIWLYQREASARSPLASVRLRNDGDASLPPGAVTIYERSGRGAVTHVGDALLAALPPGESRIVSFAVDRKVRVDREEKKEEALARARIQDGVLELVRTARRVTVYTIVGAAREPRVVVIEHPRVAGWELAEPREGVEATGDRYRIRRAVAAGETARLTVALEQPISTTIALTGLTSEQIEVYMTSRELPEALRAVFARIAELRAAIADRQRALSALESELAALRAEQERVRENLKVVPAGSSLQARYLKVLSEQEDRIAAVTGKLRGAREAVASAERALAEYVRGLSLSP